MAREREFKFDLGSEEAARRVEAELGTPGEARLQVNRFFDTPARELHRLRWALRLRGEWWLAPDPALSACGGPPDRPPDLVVLSLKGERTTAGPFHDRREEQTELPVAAWSWDALTPARLPAGWPELSPPLDGHLAEGARFANLRRTFPFVGAWRAEIDRTAFGDGRQAWEIEVEIGPNDDPEAARAHVVALLQRAGVTLQAQEKSKLQRALEWE